MRLSRAFGLAAILTAFLAGLLTSGPAGGAVFVSPAVRAFAFAETATREAPREIPPPKPKVVKKTDDASAEAAATGKPDTGGTSAGTAARATDKTSNKPSTAGKAGGKANPAATKTPAKASTGAKAKTAAPTAQSGSTPPTAAGAAAPELEKAIRDFSALADDVGAKRDAWTTLESRFQKLSSSHSPAVAAKALFYSGRVREQAAERPRPGSSDAKDDVRKACAAYSELVRRFPQSGLADDATFRKATLLADQLGDGAAARKELEFLLSEYPSGDMAGPAKALLAEQDKAAKPKASPAAARASGGQAALPTPPASAVSSASGALRAPVAPVPADAKGPAAKSADKGKTAETADSAKQAAKPASQEREATPSAPASSAERKEAKAAQADMDEPDGMDDARKPAVKPSLTAPVRAVTGLRVQNGKDFARVILDLDGKAEFSCERQDAPSEGGGKGGRLAVTFGRLKLVPKVKPNPTLAQGLLRRAAMSADAKSRATLVLDAASLGRFKAYAVEDPHRIFIDLFPAGPAGTETADAADAPNAKAKAKSGGKLDAKVEVKQGARKQSANLVEQLGLTVRTIMIDAGHGGKDPGAMAGGLREKDVNLRTAFLLGAELKARGFEVLYTRQKDVFIPLEERPVIANKRKADMFVSIHCNSAPDASANGLETYTLNLAKTADASRVAARENAVSARTISDLQFILADLMLNSKKKESDDLAHCVQTETIRCARKASFPLRDHGAKEAPFYVLMGARMPAVLVEIGYITNKEEADRMRSDAYLKSLAVGLTEGIVAYKNKIERFASL